MKVALDLEDVLVETIDLFMEELNRFIEEEHPEYDGMIERQGVVRWAFQDIRGELAELRGWDSDVQHKFFNGDGNGWEGFLPMTGRLWKESPERYEPVSSEIHDTVDDIREIVEERKGTLDLVTARMNAGDGIEQRLEQLGVLQHVNSVVLEKDKHELDYDIYIDDYPFLHKQLNEAIQIMVTQPWNSHESLEDPHVRVKSIDEVPERLKNAVG